MENIIQFSEVEKFEKYLQTKNISESTKFNYLETFKMFFKHSTGIVTLESVNDWIEYVKNNYKITAWRQYFVPLRSFLQKFYPDIYVQLIEELKVPYKKTEPEIITFLDYWKLFKEAEKLASKGNDKYVILIGLAGMCGLKSSDIANLSGKNIKEGKIYLENNPIPFNIPEQLMKYLKKYEGKDKLLFGTENGKPVKLSYLAILLRNIQKRTDLNLKRPLSVEILRNLSISRYLISQPSIPFVMNQFSYNSTKTIEDIAHYLESHGDLRVVLSVKVVDSLESILSFLEKFSLPIRTFKDFIVFSRTLYTTKTSKLSNLDIIFVVRNLNDWYAMIRTFELSTKWLEDYLFIINLDNLKIGFIECEY